VRACRPDFVSERRHLALEGRDFAPDVFVRHVLQFVEQRADAYARSAQHVRPHHHAPYTPYAHVPTILCPTNSSNICFSEMRGPSVPLPNTVIRSKPSISTPIQCGAAAPGGPASPFSPRTPCLPGSARAPRSANAPTMMISLAGEVLIFSHQAEVDRVMHVQFAHVAERHQRPGWMRGAHSMNLSPRLVSHNPLLWR
jgi:hypothetical protein